MVRVKPQVTPGSMRDTGRSLSIRLFGEGEGVGGGGGGAGGEGVQDGKK